MAFVEQCPCCFQKFASLPHRSREKQKAEKEIDEQLKEMVERLEPDFKEGVDEYEENHVESEMLPKLIG